MSSIYAFSHEVVNGPIIISAEIEKQLIDLSNYNWYHGDIERNEAESRIVNNGEFLVRLSNSDNITKFVVSTRWNGSFVHVIIKTDIEKNDLIYFIERKFSFTLVTEVIKFHKEQQYPLSKESGAVLYKPVDKKRVVMNGSTMGRESHYRKSSHVAYKQHGAGNRATTFVRSGSETHLNNQRFSTNLTTINKSLTDLSTSSNQEGPDKPDKPNIRMLSSQHLVNKIRPSFIKVRNKKLYRESGDYTDFNQLHDNEAALQRERVRRGLSGDIKSPSLRGFSGSTSSLQRKSLPQEDSTYVVPNMSSSITSSRKTSAFALLQTPVTTAAVEDTFNVYGFTDMASTPTPQQPTPVCISLRPFIQLALSQHSLLCCGFLEPEFNRTAINKASVYLTTSADHPLNLCKHLVDELRQILKIANSHCTSLRLGYRSIFLSESEMFIQHLRIRQTALSQFIIASILCTTSTDKRIRLIIFWIHCADNMLNQIKDMFHLRSVVRALFSDRISRLSAWSRVYRQDTNARRQMESLRRALKAGSQVSADINRCVPDLPQLCDLLVEPGQESSGVAVVASLDEMWGVAEAATRLWTEQEFENPKTWLVRISTEMECLTSIPFLRELVQTETILCFIFGSRDLSCDDVFGGASNELENRFDQLIEAIKDDQV